jgi:hypothetical protein
MLHQVQCVQINRAVVQNYVCLLVQGRYVARSTGGEQRSKTSTPNPRSCWYEEVSRQGNMVRMLYFVGAWLKSLAVLVDSLSSGN